MKGRGQYYETYCDFSKSSYHQQADGKNKYVCPKVEFLLWELFDLYLLCA